MSYINRFILYCWLFLILHELWYTTHNVYSTLESYIPSRPVNYKEDSLGSVSSSRVIVSLCDWYHMPTTSLWCVTWDDEKTYGDSVIYRLCLAESDEIAEGRFSSVLTPQFYVYHQCI